nr:ribosomal protein S16 [Boldiaceae sp.]
MIKIRLKRCGRKKQPVYRIVIINAKTRRNGKPIEEVGYYNPRTKETKLNSDRITKKLAEGAQATKTVNYILNKYNQ